MFVRIDFKIMEEFFRQLKENGGAIVSTKDCSETEIYFARAEGRMFVCEDGCGFVLRSQKWLDYAKESIEILN